jgi:phage-related minor tail protein
MSQKKAAENIDLFEGWIGRQTNADFKNLVRRGQLNRQEVANAVGFSKSVLRQNPAVKARLAQLEDDLRPIGILPEKTEQRVQQEKENKPKKYDGEASRRSYDKRRLQELEAQNLELKVKLKRYEELSEVLTEMGIEF